VRDEVPWSWLPVLSIVSEQSASVDVDAIALCSLHHRRAQSA